MEMQLLSLLKSGGQALYRKILKSDKKNYLAIEKHTN